MKKLFALILLCLIALPSCNSPTRAAELLSYETRAGELSISFRADGRDFSATLAPGERLTFVSPASVAGMSFLLRDGEISVASADVGEAVLGDFPLPRAVFDCFSLADRVERGELEFVSESEGVFVFEGGGVRYEIYRASGALPTRIVRHSDGEILTVDITASTKPIKI